MKLSEKFIEKYCEIHKGKGYKVTMLINGGVALDNIISDEFLRWLDENSNLHERVVKPTLAGEIQILYKNDAFGEKTKPDCIRDKTGMLFQFKDITKYTGQLARYRSELQEQRNLAEYLLTQLSKCSL